MTFHWLLATCIIGTTSANITPVQSLSTHLSKFQDETIDSMSSPRRLVNAPRPHPQADVHIVAADVHEDFDYAAYFEDVEDELRDILDPDILAFYDAEASEFANDILITVAFRELVDAEFDTGDLEIDEIAEEIAQILTDAYNEADCRAILEDYDDFLDAFENGGRRRLVSHVDDLLAFYGLFFLFTFRLSESEATFIFDALSEETYVDIIFGQGSLALISADCDIVEAGDDPSNPLDLFRDFIEATSDAESDDEDDDDDDDDDDEDEGEGEEEEDEDDDDDDDDESDSGESGDDAKSVNEAEDDLDFEIEQNEDGSETVTLEMATSTMTNIWIALIVFCGFNMSLFWFFMERKKKQSVHYETAEDVPSVSVHH